MRAEEKMFTGNRSLSMNLYRFQNNRIRHPDYFPGYLEFGSIRLESGGPRWNAANIACMLVINSRLQRNEHTIS